MQHTQRASHIFAILESHHDHKTYTPRSQNMAFGVVHVAICNIHNPNCMCCYCGVHRIALCIYLRVFANPVHAHTCCALRTFLKRPNARKRDCTRSRTSNACDCTQTRRLGVVHVAICDTHNPKSLHTFAFNAMRTWRALARIQCARWHALEVYMNDSKQIDPVRSSPDGRTDTHIFARPPP